MMFIHPEFTYDPDWYKSDSSIKETSEEKNDGGLIATIERKSDSESDEPTPQFSKPASVVDISTDPRRRRYSADFLAFNDQISSRHDLKRAIHELQQIAESALDGDLSIPDQGDLNTPSRDRALIVMEVEEFRREIQQSASELGLQPATIPPEDSLESLDEEGMFEMLSEAREYASAIEELLDRGQGDLEEQIYGHSRVAADAIRFHEDEGGGIAQQLANRAQRGIREEFDRENFGVVTQDRRLILDLLK
jgi:hypothetical protein